jgi:hypothetical protein
MNYRPLLGGVLTALAFGTSLLAQSISVLPGATISPIVLEQSYTTGMVGFTTGQTARLNVLNLNPVPSATATTKPLNCNVSLQFLDNKGATISQTTVTNFAPGTATSFDVPRASVTSETASPRAEIRGMVVVNPTAIAGTSSAAATEGNCAVKTTLEVYDATGSTISSTSDAQLVGVPSVVSLISIR